jgi:hypothetical protein
MEKVAEKAHSPADLPGCDSFEVHPQGTQKGLI